MFILMIGLIALVYYRILNPAVALIAYMYIWRLLWRHRKQDIIPTMDTLEDIDNRERSEHENK